MESFTELRSFPPVRDAADEQAFTSLLRSIYARHANVVPVMAMGVAELKAELNAAAAANRRGFAASVTRAEVDMPEIHSFLDGFYLSRIGIRILIGQHIALHEPPRPDYIGLVCTRCSPVRVARDAIDDARAMCAREYGSAPAVDVYGDPAFTFAYVPSHLHHMLFELVKNSLRAVTDRFEESDADPPPVRLVVAEGDEDVTLKVSDEGGGIPRSGLPNIWTYLYSTARSPLADMAADGDGGDGPAVLAGYGYGLPISRLYARYFGGDLQVRENGGTGGGGMTLCMIIMRSIESLTPLFPSFPPPSLQIISMENYGTDAYLHLNRLGNVSEPLP